MTRSPAMDRLLALGLLGLMAALFVLLVLLPGFRAESAARAETERLSRLVAQADARAAVLEPASAALAEAEALRASHPAWTPPADPALLVARLQTELRDMVQAAGGVPSLTRAGEPVTEGKLTRQDIRVQFTGDDATLRALLYEIDHARPDLRLEALSVRVLRTRDARQYLSMDMTVTALLDAGEGDG